MAIPQQPKATCNNHHHHLQQQQQQEEQQQYHLPQDGISFYTELDTTIEFCIPFEVLLYQQQQQQQQQQQHNEGPATTSSSCCFDCRSTSSNSLCRCCIHTTTIEDDTNDSTTIDTTTTTTTEGCGCSRCCCCRTNNHCTTTTGCSDNVSCCSTGCCCPNNATTKCCCNYCSYNEDMIKDWILDNCRDQLRSAFRIKPVPGIKATTTTKDTLDEKTATTTTTKSSPSSISHHKIDDEEKEDEEKEKEEEEEGKEKEKVEEQDDKRTEDNDKDKDIDTKERLVLYDQINQVHRQYVSNDPKAHELFDKLLDCVVEITGSKFGFIGEIGYEDAADESTIYLLCQAATNIAWDKDSNDFYEQNIIGGLKFSNLNTLVGYAMTSAVPLLTNDAKNHPRAAGTPPGHPPLNHFLCLPYKLPGSTAKLDGLVGVANKPGGYSQKDIDLLEPLLLTCSNYVHTYRLNAQNEQLITKLEDLVHKRTEELNLANQTIVKAAKMQIEHFACMSHEIRTPLNCVVGLSSVLAETELNPFQKDSLQMIIQSSELLMAVVNDVLDYSKLQTGNMTVDIHETNIQDTIDAVVHSIERKMPEKNITVKTNYDFTIPELVHTDSRRVQQILYNLLGNAVKFSHPNGVVELSVQLVRTDDNNNANSNDEKEEDVDTDPKNPVKSCPPSPKITPITTTTAIGASLPSTRHYSEPKSPKPTIFDVALQELSTSSVSSKERSKVAPSLLPPQHLTNNTNPTTIRRNNSPNGCPYLHGSNAPEKIQSSSSSSCPYTPSSTTTKTTLSTPSQKQSSQQELETIFNSSYCVPPKNDSTVDRKKIPRNHSSGSKSSQGNSPSKIQDQQQQDEQQHSDIPATIKDDDQHVVVTDASSPYRLRFVVKDYGKGIAKDDFDTIFQPFQQATKQHTTTTSDKTSVSDGTNAKSKTTTTTLPEGTGLGLAITSRLVEGLGGIITVDSELGQWSEFALEIPFIGTPYQPIEWDSHVSKGKEPIRIVLVSRADDYETTAETIRCKFNIDPSVPIHQYNTCDGFQILQLQQEQEPKLRDGSSIIWRNVCIIDESLYDRTLYTSLAASFDSVLFTYGPNYSVPESYQHYRSLHRVLPSIMIRAIHQWIQRHNVVSESESSATSAVVSAALRPTGSHKIDLPNPLFNSDYPPTVISSIPTTTTSDYSSYRVLIAEDNKINQKILVSMLNRVGLRTIDVVENGKLAYEYATTNCYDIIFMDMQMPLMSGLEATEAIVSKLGKIRTGPVIIFVTAHASKDYEDKAREVGGNGFLSKPFNLNSIRNVLESIPTILLPQIRN